MGKDKKQAKINAKNSKKLIPETNSSKASKKNDLINKVKPINTKLDTIKEATIQALEKSLGIVTTACRQIGISRSTHYNWMAEDIEYKKRVEAIADIALDFAESKLHQSIQAGSDTATIFYLKCKAKKRGYVERTEIDHTTKGESLIPKVDLSKLTTEELTKLYELNNKLAN